MKVIVSMKDPDGVGDAVREAADAEARRIAPGADARQIDLLTEDLVDGAHERLKRWVEYGEYVEVEFDLEAMTARVVAREGGGS